MLKHVGSTSDEDGPRDLYVAFAPDFLAWRELAATRAWRELIETPDRPFALFLAADTAHLEANLIADFARYCIDNEVFWMSAWGTGCSRVDDVFDREDVGYGEHPDAAVVLTAWHEDETLKDATDLFWTAFGADGKPVGSTRLALVIGDPAWADELSVLARAHLDED